MNIRAIIFYCGWALMVPNIGQDKQSPKTWPHYGSFDTARECERFLRAAADAKGNQPDYQRALDAAKCLPMEIVYGAKEKGTWH